MSARFLRTLAVTLSLSGLVALTGCASEGNETLKNETSASIDQKIHDGVTTKDQIRALFGDPRESTFTDSGGAGDDVSVLLCLLVCPLF